MTLHNGRNRKEQFVLNVFILSEECEDFMTEFQFWVNYSFKSFPSIIRSWRLFQAWNHLIIIHNRHKSTLLNIHTTLTAILASGSGVLLKSCDSLQECLSKRFILSPLNFFILIFAFETEYLAHMWKCFFICWHSGNVSGTVLSAVCSQESPTYASRLFLPPLRRACSGGAARNTASTRFLF